MTLEDLVRELLKHTDGAGEITHDWGCGWEEGDVTVPFKKRDWSEKRECTCGLSNTLEQIKEQLNDTASK